MLRVLGLFYVFAFLIFLKLLLFLLEIILFDLLLRFLAGRLLPARVVLEELHEFVESIVSDVVFLFVGLVGFEHLILLILVPLVLALG